MQNRVTLALGSLKHTHTHIHTYTNIYTHTHTYTHAHTHTHAHHMFQHSSVPACEGGIYNNLSTTAPQSRYETPTKGLEALHTLSATVAPTLSGCALK